MAAHHIPDTTGCVYMIGRNKVFVPTVGFLDRESFNVVMGRPSAWDVFLGYGPPWANTVNFSATEKHSVGSVEIDGGIRMLTADTLFGWPKE